MSHTASSMIMRSLQLTGEKAINGSLTSAEKTVYLEALNSMLDSWSIERLLIYTILQESFALTNNTISYTIGTGGDFNTTRPVKIIDPCFVRDSSNLDSAIEILDVESYGRIVFKTSGKTYPSYLYYDAGFSATSTATLKVYPAPSSGLTLFINSYKSLQSFSNISTAALLPPGYQRAIESNLCIELAAGYRPVSAEVVKIARESKAAIKGINLPDSFMRLDAGIVGVRPKNSVLTGP